MRETGFKSRDSDLKFTLFPINLDYVRLWQPLATCGYSILEIWLCNLGTEFLILFNLNVNFKMEKSKIFPLNMT